MQTTAPGLSAPPAALTARSGVIDVLAWVKDRPAIEQHAELVGRWVWVFFPAKPSADTLAELKNAGFWFAKASAAGRPAGWYHTCGTARRRIRGGKVDPRETHGTIPTADLEIGGAE